MWEIEQIRMFYYDAVVVVILLATAIFLPMRNENSKFLKILFLSGSLIYGFFAFFWHFDVFNFTY